MQIPGTSNTSTASAKKIGCNPISYVCVKLEISSFRLFMVGMDGNRRPPVYVGRGIGKMCRPEGTDCVPGVVRDKDPLFVCQGGAVNLRCRDGTGW